MPGNLQEMPPPAVVASWPPPNYVDPIRRTWMPAYAGTLQAVMTVLLSLRIWLRISKRSGVLGLDDALLVPAFLGATMFTTLAILTTMHYGNDRHIWDVPITEFEDNALVAWLSELAFFVSTCSTKVSVLLFYRRLVQGTYSKRWKWATIAAICTTIGYGLAFILVLVLNCRPTEAYWKSFSLTYTQNYTCVDTKKLNTVAGVISVVSDLYSVILPMGMLRHFETDRRKKIALNAVFSLGLLVAGAGVVRTYYITKLGMQYDITWVGFDCLVWSDLEMQLAIICASAPALRVFFRQFLKDPVSRAMRSASSLNRSGLRSTTRDSRQTDMQGVVTYSQKSDDMDLSGQGDKNLIKHSMKPSLETVGEQDTENSYSPSTAPSERYAIKTPADYETYALQNLERYRQSPRSPTRSPSTNYSMRFTHDDPMRERLSQPFADWKAPRSWLDTDGKA